MSSKRRAVSTLVVLLMTAASGCGSSKRAATLTTTSTTEAPLPTTTSAPATTAAPLPTTTSAPATTTTLAPTRTTPKPTTTTTAGAAARAKVTLTPVATLEAPDAMAVRAGDPALYVAERAGRVRRIENGTVDPTPVLDITAETRTDSERGLLGLAFSPDGSKLYVDDTGPDGTIRILEFGLRDGRAVDRREVLTIDHRQFGNHDGGDITFGPDGMLYIGVGDGGSEGDPNGRGQSLGTLLAKLLRIDPRPSGSAAYQIPAGNPFATRAGARPEIWAFGLRNPWRFSFDRTTNDLWIGDVGQNAYEEIDRAGAASKGGENYGWSLREATHTYKGARPAGNVDPVYEYAHTSGGCAVTGGYVYRGAAIANLAGSYLFADFCQGDIQALTLASGRAVATDLHLHVDQPASFGQDGAGELYVLSLAGGVFKLTPG